MPAVFGAHVHVTDTEGVSHVFSPGQAVPGWAVGLIGAHVLAPDPHAVPDAPVVAHARVVSKARA